MAQGVESEELRSRFLAAKAARNDKLSPSSGHNLFVHPVARSNIYKGMRRRISIAGWAILAAVLATASASAQRFFVNSMPPVNHSIPASVTSVVDNSGNFNNSIPPSVTSIRPGRILLTSPTVVPAFHRHHRQVIPIFVPVYPGYGYPYSYYPDYDPMVPSYAQPQPVTASAPVEEPEAPAQTVFENRPGYKAAAAAYGEPGAPAQTATATPAPAAPSQPAASITPV